MPKFYQQDMIELGDNPHFYGHVVYKHAKFVPQKGSSTPIVYKENKKNNPIVSQFEAALGELARLFFAPHLTPPQTLVKDADGSIVGIACEHISYTIAHREGLPTVFYRVEPRDDGLKQFAPMDTVDTGDIPYYFLDAFQPGFFNDLCESEKRGDISLDMPSLAQILVGSYTLEEDDLHKGNLGFYVVEKNDKPHVVFFKVDHDLMLADSLMSHYQSRFLHWGLGKNAFDISVQDLMHFPLLKDSSNFYWPTLAQSFGLGAKAYSSAEAEAFALLADNDEFRQEKWRAFYKHVLIPPALIWQALSLHLDEQDPSERAQIACITQAVVARQAKLRAVLFATPAFRDMVSGMTDEARQSIVQEIMPHHRPTSSTEGASLADDINDTMKWHQDLCQEEDGFSLGDTPLHAAIRLQDYRYEESWSSFSQFATVTNVDGQTPLDLAMSLNKMTADTTTVDIGANSSCIVAHLLQQGAPTTQDKIAIDLEQALSQNEYVSCAAAAKTATQLKTLLRTLGEDTQFCLKMQKEMAVLCVREFIKNNQQNQRLSGILHDLKISLNGADNTLPAPELQFIRQLRSELWIVRLIRGLLGGTATQVKLNGMIDDALAQLQPPSCFWSFFSSPQPVVSTQKEEVPLDEEALLPKPYRF